MEELFITLKEVPINNNCPECFNNTEIKIVFKQKYVETKYYKSITNVITQDIYCSNCQTLIYPVRWTEDIERVVDYEKKLLIPKPKSTYIKKPTWILVIAAILVIIICIALLMLFKF